MPPAVAPDPETALLSDSNLQKLKAEGLKAERLRSFVVSQARFIKAQAAEGPASWELRAASPQVPHLSVFDTPVLQPRVARDHLVAAKLLKKEGYASRDDEVGDGDACAVEVPAWREHCTRNGASGKQDGTPGPKALHDNVISKRSAKVHVARAATKRRASKTRSDSDEEHAQRLVERRQRKNAKRHMTKAPAPSSSSVCPEGDRETGAVREAGHKKQDKNDVRGKEKASKPSVGLALMHGFSSTNVGKARLTFQPPIKGGVFNKGMASAKAKVAESRQSTAKGGHTFSEDHFLGKSQNEQTVKQTQIKHKPKIQSKREVADSPSASERLAPASQCSSSSSGSAVACERRPCVQVVEKPIKITGQTKARRTHSSREASLAGNACSPGSDAEQSVGIAPVSDARSEPWLIESPTRSLPSSSGGSVSRSRSKATTAILDVRGLTWGRMLDDAGTASAGIKALATADGCPNSLAQDSQAATRDDDRCSSLGPSESASQVPVRSWIQPFLEPSVSKYFSEHVPKSQHAVPEQTERREHQTLDGHRDRGRTDWDAPRQHTPEQDIQRRLAPSLYAAHDASESFTLGNDGFKRTPLDGRTQNHRRSPSPEIIDLIPYSAQDSLLASLHGVQQDTLEEVQASDFDSYLYDGHDTHCDSRQLHDLQEGEGDLSEAGDDTAQDRWDAQDYTYASTWSDGIDYLPAEPSLVDMDVAQDAEDFESTYAMETEASQVELVEALQYERGLYDDVLHDSSDGFREGESVADDTDGDETTSGEEAWQPQGDLLLSRRGGRGHARSQPRTVHGVEIDVARAMNARAHWHPQKL